MIAVVNERTRIMSFQDGCSPLVAFTGLAAAFLVLVTVFFALGEESGEDRSDDMAILRQRWMQKNFDYSDGRAKVIHQELEIPLLSRRDSKSRVTCVCVCL